jgi:hypothetical protein
MLKNFVGCSAVLAMGASIAFAQGTPESSRFSVTPHLGVVSESDFVSGLVRFSDGDTDYISIEPRTGLLLGAEVSYRFRPKISGVLGLSFTSADARYIEKDSIRREAGVSTIRIQPGVMVDVVQGRTTDVAVGGGLTLAWISIEDLFWDGGRVDPDSTAIGVFGAGAIDVALSRRLSFHAHLAIELSKPSYGDLEDGLARADREVAAEVDHDVRSALLLGVGLTIAL